LKNSDIIIVTAQLRLKSEVYKILRKKTISCHEACLSYAEVTRR
jgi:hypothetical protein